ncbi:zinc finger CCHC-type containing 7 [Pitangus sulphuratus]|nr:zinc finger CCHC-type containing 7 [Pitangus sulphuratus]
MFTGYDDAEDSEVYEDELYHEESSSEQSVDSEVEFHLYSQIHYSQNLGEISMLEVDKEADVAEVMGHSSVLTEKQDEDKKPVSCQDEEFTNGGAQLSDDSEIIVLSDTPDEVSIYKSKAKRSRSLSAQEKTHIHPVSSTPSHAKAAGYNALCPPGSGAGAPLPRQRKSTIGRPSPIHSPGAEAIQEVLVIDDSSEETSLISDSDNVESWMLLGAGADDRDGDIILNLEGCATPVSEDLFMDVGSKQATSRAVNRSRISLCCMNGSHYPEPIEVHRESFPHAAFQLQSPVSSVMEDVPLPWDMSSRPLWQIKVHSSVLSCHPEDYSQSMSTSVQYRDVSLPSPL